MNCKKCSTEFSSSVRIDGKIRNLCNRKYCFDCSPFGKHNTRKIHSSEYGKTLICDRCKKSYVKMRHYRKSFCRSCSVTVHRIKLKESLVMRFGGKCILCGYDKCIGALEFHHLDPSAKERGISGSTVSAKKLTAEADKCMLVCNRCHREVHCGVILLPSGAVVAQ